MSVYTVHEPPLRTADALTDPERFVFVRDGFYWWAFLLAPLWMLRHRLWLVLVVYLVVSAALDAAMQRVGMSAFAIASIGILVSLLVGFEASTLWRFTLRRRRWKDVGIVSGDDLEDAERRFFDAWLRNTSARGGPPRATTPGPPASPAPPPAAPGSTEVSGVVGLFPEPGVQR
jgi:Protein of unknown function (DUF2628)